MVYIWGVLAAIQPAFLTVTDASDPRIRALMKRPASWPTSDSPRSSSTRSARRLGCRRRGGDPPPPRRHRHQRLVGPIRVHLPALGAGGLGLRGDGQNGPAAARGRVADDQAPGAAVHPPVRGLVLGLGGWRELLRTAAIGLGTSSSCGCRSSLQVARALPEHLAAYQSGDFAILSLRAWNAWWLVQELGGRGLLRHGRCRDPRPAHAADIGFVYRAAVAARGSLAVLRDPRPRTLALGLAAATLVAFCFLTSMHERYSYGVSSCSWSSCPTSGLAASPSGSSSR